MRTIIAVSDAFDDFPTDFFKGVSRFLRTRPNYSIRHCPQLEVDHKGQYASCDGIIANLFRASRIEALKSARVPIVDLSGMLTEDPTIISVDSNADMMAQLAADRFLQRGFTHFGFYGRASHPLCDLLRKAFTSRIRESGFQCSVHTAIALHSLSEEKQRAAQAKDNRRTLEWVASLPPRTAVFCLNDFRARNLLSKCLKLGRAVPNDIAILGTGNISSQCLCTVVPLSSIDCNWEGLGYAAMRILASAIECPVKPKPRKTFLVPPGPIVERESTAVYPVDPPWLADAMSLVDCNISRPISTADLAAAAGVSQTTLSAEFHKQFKMTAGQYILSAKMQRAKDLAAEGGHTVKEIAYAIGFSSASYFSRTYKDYFGHSPSLDGKKRL